MDEKRSRALLEGQNRALQLALAGAPLAEVLEVLARTAQAGCDDGIVAAILLPDEEAQAPRPATPAGQLHACWAVPIRGAQGAVLGTFALYAGERREPSPQERERVERLSETAALVIEHHRQREETRASSQRKDEFLATLAHELRNPLAPIASALGVLRTARAGPTADKLLEVMDRQLRHMVHMVDDLLDVSRVTSGKITLRTETLDLPELVDSAVETSLPAIKAAGHAFEVRIEDEALQVTGDRTRLCQVFTNLLNNAAKYTPPGGRIELVARREGDSAVLQVRDDGLGIPREMLSRVFELFAQVGHAAEHTHGGLGLGLALVKKLVQMHGGEVSADSAGLGRGSTFTVRLPLARVPASAARPVDTAAAADVAAAPFRILVVDDNADAAESLAMLLQLARHETATAYSGRDALAQMKLHKPGAVFLDIGLPGMSGYEVARAIRADPGLRDVTLIALTGWASESDRRKAVDAGFDYHLTKPAAPDAVQELLARIAGARSPERACA